MRFDGQSISRKTVTPPANTGHVHVHIDGCYLSNHRMSLPFRRRDGVVEMREVAPVIIATERPLGDTLALLPFAYEFRGRVTITGNFHRLVPPLCSGIEFDPEGSAHGAHYVVASFLSAGILQERGLLLHANQVPFLQYDLPAPALPIVLPHATAPCGLERGIVIAPFSHAADKAHQALKVWDHARWVAVVEALRALGHAGPIYVLGVGADDPAPCVAAGIHPVFDRPLTEVLDLLKRSPLVMTIDNGISHVAQLGGVSRHVLLYPDTMRPGWAEAPLALIAPGATPGHIRPAAVVDWALRVLARDDRP
jgi:hypothetical protein